MVMTPSATWWPHVHAYGALLVAAWALGWWLARRRARRIGIAVWHIDGLLPLLLIATALGSRLGGRTSQFLADGAANDRVLFGGLFAAVALVIVYALATRLPLGRLGDTFAFSLPAGIALLRVGCFFGGCCWGDICASPERLAAAVDDPAWRRQVQTFPALCGSDWPLSVRYPAGSPAYYQHLTACLLPPSADRSLPVHPVPLYEAAATLMLWGLLWVADKRLRRWGESFLLFGLGYCAVRFIGEWFRADSALLVGNLTLAQLVCLGAASACAVTWWARSRLAERGQVELFRCPDRRAQGEGRAERGLPG
jgi:phosphatidylglycerol:prolipoprotein diacylglycerol transferase